MVTTAEEFKRNPELKEADLQHIKEWLSMQPHMPHGIPDELVILIMHSCYYSLEMSKTTLDKYFTLRTHLPEMFANREINRYEIQETFKTINMIPLEGRTKQGYKVILIGFNRFDPQLYNFGDSCIQFNMIADALFHLEGTYPGFVIVYDFTGVKLGHVSRLSLAVMKKLLTYLQDGLPVRLKNLHFTNVVPFIDKIVAMMKPFMKKELMNLFVLHNEGSNTIYEFVPKHCFPNERGGSAGSMDALREKTYQLVNNYQEWYKQDERLRVDESKRPGKAITAGDLFGVDGSFRKLDFD